MAKIIEPMTRTERAKTTNLMPAPFAQLLPNRELLTNGRSIINSGAASPFSAQACRRSSALSSLPGRNPEHLVNPAPVQIDNLKAPALVVEIFSGLRQVP